MSSDHNKDQYGTSAPTKGGQRWRPGSQRPDLNGQRLGLEELNLGHDDGQGKRERLPKRFLRGLAQFLAGMYTGESCAGTPHGERKPGSASRRRPDAK